MTAAAPRVLIVDDRAAEREHLERRLRDWDIDTVAVADGVAAMDALWHGVASGRRFTLLLVDPRVADALLARVRERGELSTIRVMVLTPQSPDERLAAIRRALDEPPVARRILVAEDNEFNAQLLEQLLTRRGQQVTVAPNGRVALERLAADSVDLLLLDLHMPEVDGFQVIATLRAREQSTGEHLPVIALTARARPEDRARCLAAGIDDFLTKPIHAGNLWAAIERATAAPREAAALDRAVLWAACGGDAAILDTIKIALRERLPEELATVEDALRAGDAPRLREAAHRLTAMIAAVSSHAGALTSDVEDHAAEGRLDRAAPLVAQVTALVPALFRELEAVTVDQLRTPPPG